MLDIQEISINGFKSLMDTGTTLNKLNVVIGPNGSGKTNFLEFFLLLQKIIKPKRSPTSPFSRWGGYQNICHKHNTEQIIDFQIKGKVDEHAFTYQAKLSGRKESVNFLFESLQVPNAFTIKRENEKITISYPEKLLTKLRQIKKSGSGNGRDELFQSLLDTRIQEAAIKNSTSIMNFMQDVEFTCTGDFAYGSFNGMTCVSDVFLDSNKNQTPSFACVMNSLNFYNVLFVKSICNVHISENHDQQNQLDEDGGGLIILLYNWFLQNNKRFPSMIENAIKALFPGWELGFNLNQKGTVTLNATSDGTTYASKNLPDGMLKMLFILTALYRKPKILLIDEIENSLHPDMIRYVLQECLDCEDTTVFMTTHSPHIMDFCDIRSIILAERVGSSSSFSHVNNIDELTKQLVETEMTFSDAYFDGNL